MKTLIYSSILLIALQVHAQNPITELYTQNIFKINSVLSISELDLSISNINFDLNIDPNVKSIKFEDSKKETVLYFAALASIMFACGQNEHSDQCNQPLEQPLKIDDIPR